MLSFIYIHFFHLYIVVIQFCISVSEQYKKFKRRLKSKLKKCTLSCKPELFIKIIQRVKIRLLKFGEECKT